MSDLVIFSGRSNPTLTKDICTILQLEQGKITTTDFSDGETFVQLNESVRGKDVFFVQSTCNPSDKNLMELLIMMDAARRSSAERITAVMPYYGYGRQDRKDRPRVPITAKLVANMLTQAGANRILSLEMHTGQLQGFFDIPVDTLVSAPHFVSFLKRRNISNLAIVAPDAGSVERANIYADHLGARLAVIDKRRDRTTNNKSEVMRVVGDVLGKNVVIVDDMIDTAGTLCNSVNALLKEGAEEVFAIATHGVFSGAAFQRIFNSKLSSVFVMDTIPEGRLFSTNKHKIDYHSCAPLLAEAIMRIHTGDSVSSLLNIKEEDGE